MPAKPKVCVIGAGSSGIAVAKALHDRAIPFDCFEMSDRVGGLWIFRNRTGRSPAYRSLRTNTSRERTAYADFPMPPDYPDFPHHSQMAAYFDAYVDRFGLRERITFNTAVAHAARLASGRWRVTLGTGEAREYDALIVANGHHWEPRWPEPPIPGRFAGAVLHSHDYIDPGEPVDTHGKRVVVVGMGNSAMDIACELSAPGVAERVYLSARRGAWIVPKYLFGRPLDRLGVTHPLVPLPEFAVCGGRVGIRARFQDVIGGAGKACAYRRKGDGRGQPTARIGLGLETSSFSRIAASSGVIRLA